MSENNAPQPDNSEERDQRLEAVIADYIRACETGSVPNRGEILKRYPEFADELRQFFGQHDRMNQIAAPIRGFGDALAEAVGPGQQLSYVGNYELLEEIARGGMGVVYKARQTTLGRIVAVKMIVSGRLASEQDVQRFQVEAQAAAGLQHSNIVSIHEVGQHEGWHYFSMDYVEGRDLSKILRENLLSAKQAATYVRQMAEAIHYAHERGILHRDLKPSNILIDSHDQVRITDFGLAMCVEGSNDLTRTGQIVGTPSYMPPEQAQANRSLIGPGSDVYSLGAVLYECLTGRAPFRADSVLKTIEQVIHAEAASPRTLNAAIPRDLETICLKCLEKEPNRRYGTAQLLADDLQRFLIGEPIIARPARALERTVKWVKRHPTPTALIVSSAIALLALVGVGIGLYYNSKLNSAYVQVLTGNQQLGEAKATLESRNQQLSEASEQVSSERALAHRHLYASRMALIQVAMQNDQPARIVQLLRSVIPESEAQEDLRDFEWHHLWRKYHGEESRLLGHTGPVIAVASSPDGKWIASGSTDRTIKIWNATTSKEHRTFAGHSDLVNEVAFSLDSQQIVSRSADDIVKVWDINTGAEVTQLSASVLQEGTDEHIQFWISFGGETKSRLCPAGKGQTTCSAYSVDRSRSVEGKTTYTNEKVSSTVRIMNSKTEIPIASFDFAGIVTQVAISRDGALVAAAGSDQLVRVWTTEAGFPMCILHAPDGVCSVAISSDASHIFAGTENRLLMIWALPGSEERVFHPTHSNYRPNQAIGRWGPWANCVMFGDGGTLLAAVVDTDAIVWNVSTGQKLSTLAVGANCRIAMASKGNLIAGAPPNKLSDVQTNKVVTEFLNAGSPFFKGGGGPFGYAISGDDSLVAIASGAVSVTVHDMKTGKLFRSFKIPEWASSVAFSPDAKLLAAGSGYYMQAYESRGTIAVREIESGRIVYEEKLHLDIWCLSFNPQGTLLAAAMGIFEDAGANLGRIRVWNTATWETVYDLRGHSGCVWSLGFNASGNRLASVGGVGLYRKTGGSNSPPPGEFMIWDTTTGDELLTIAAKEGAIFGVAFSPDGTRLATAGGDGSVRLWNGTPLAETPRYEPLPAD